MGKSMDGSLADRHEGQDSRAGKHLLTNFQNGKVGGFPLQPMTHTTCGARAQVDPEHFLK